MGQRTAFLIKKKYRVYNRDKSMFDEVCEISLLHHQWGIGKVMPMIFLSQLINAEYPCNRNYYQLHYNKGKVIPYFNFPYLDTDPYMDKEIFDCDVDVWNKETRVKLFNKTDNNNGGMIIELEQLYDEINNTPLTCGKCYNCKIGFVLGNEETKKPFEKIVTAKQYMNKTFRSGKQENNKFYKAFKVFLDFFEIEEYKEEKEGE